MSTLHVAIVDDEIDHTVIARHVLATIEPAAEISVLTSSDDLQADLAALPAASLILLDHHFATVDTIELLPAVRAARPDLGVVLLSAAVTDGDRTGALAAGAMLVEEKPADLGGWREALARAVAMHRSHR